ncbi:hypothetical protein CBR_g19552 [Chara braunii]|uniref:Uncharacterized protein n=1 Tax=Chara braunii TaxID=69332 RepID=A0A388KYA5_CHABU|nr:hypothetical protein CBR_g19552 [Chara braunii]|eukprot:GBG75039.1 hypothetical protein CBR_g19552 [Chara braunii]
MLARPLRVAEAAAAKWAREVSRYGEERVLNRISVERAGEFGLPSAPLRVILPEFLIEKSFGGQARVEAAAEAALRARDWGLTKMWDEKAMWYMFPVSVCEGLSEEVYTLMLKSQTWDELEASLKLRFPEDGVECRLGKGLEQPTNEVANLGCEGLSEEVYTLMLKSQTWDELEASLKLRFPEDGVECRLGKGPEQPAEAASTQGELSGIQRQVGMLEERLARLEEARCGERKTFEGASNRPAGQDEAEVREDHQELLLLKRILRGRVCAPGKVEDEGIIEIEEEQEASMALPVIAPEPKGGPIGGEASSAAGRERQRNEWWLEHWAKVVCDG